MALKGLILIFINLSTAARSAAEQALLQDFTCNISYFCSAVRCRKVELNHSFQALFAAQSAAEQDLCAGFYVFFSVIMQRSALQNNTCVNYSAALCAAE